MKKERSIKAVLSEKLLFSRSYDNEGIVSRIKLFSYIKGKYIFSKYKKIYKNAFVLCSHIGEVVFTCSYVDAYKNTWKIDRCCVITLGKFSDIVKLYNVFDDIFVLSPLEIRALSYYLRNKDHLRTGFVNDIWKNSYSQSLFNQCKHSETGYHAEFYTRYLKIDGNSTVCRPDITRIDECLDSDRVLNECNEKSVLICPMASTVKRIPDLFWEKLVCEIRNKGYKVYINGGLQIADSIAINPGLIELIDLARKAKRTISLQSGLSDLLVELMVDCHVIMYEEQAYFRRKNDYPFVVPSLIGINEYTDFDMLVDSLVDGL